MEEVPVTGMRNRFPGLASLVSSRLASLPNFVLASHSPRTLRARVALDAPAPNHPSPPPPGTVTNLIRLLLMAARSFFRPAIA